MKPVRGPSGRPAAATTAVPAAARVDPAAAAVAETTTAVTYASPANRAGRRSPAFILRAVDHRGEVCPTAEVAKRLPKAKKLLKSGTKTPSLLHCWQALGEIEGNGGRPSFAVSYRWWVVRSSFSLSFASARSAFAARPPVLATL